MMKAIRSTLFILFLFIANNLFSQAHFTITDLIGLPTSGQDTAFSNSPYNNIIITIKNTGNQAFQGELDVFIMGSQQISDSLFVDSIGGTTLNINDSTDKFVNSYQFNSAHFIDGDNIVVVWPQARSMGVPVDTTTFHLYFVTIQSVEEPDRKQLHISPNPGTDYIRLEMPDNNNLEQVRIFNTEGRLLYESSHSQELIRIKDWPSGLYFIEVIGKNSAYSGRLIIE